MEAGMEVDAAMMIAAVESFGSVFPSGRTGLFFSFACTTGFDVIRGKHQGPLYDVLISSRADSTVANVMSSAS